MPRNRMLKPEFWSSETINSLSLGARLLFIGMWNFADDYGTLLNNDRRIMGDIFPLDNDVTEVKIKKWKKEIIKVNLLIELITDKGKFLYIRSWQEHQKVPNPSKRFCIDPIEIQSLIKDKLDSNEDLITDDVSKEKEERERRKKKEERERLVSLENDFEVFYSFYPVKKNQKKAKDIYIKKGLKGELPEIDQHLKIIKNNMKSDLWQKNNGRYISYPNNWLSEEKYSDEILVNTKPDKDKNMYEKGEDVCKEVFSQLGID